jgi:hypothetical protein
LSEQRRKIVDGQTKLRQQLTALLKSYFPVVLELFGGDHQLNLLLSMLGRWPDPRKLRSADRRLIRHVLSEHSIRNTEKQDEIILRIRSAQLLSRDDALITPSAMAVKLLANQIQEVRKTIKEFDAKIRLTGILSRLLTWTAETPDFETSQCNVFRLPATGSHPPQSERRWLELPSHEVNDIARG